MIVKMVGVNTCYATTPQKDYEALVSKLPKYSIICRENVKGYNYVRTDWRSLVYTFPDKWILYTNVDIVEGRCLFLCTVLAICDNDTVYPLKIRLRHEGYCPCSLRTTNGITGEEML